ncbi:hypothetical protein BY458DRAFT_544917 [Sporodiniella umbellata]|nr:hypothetical protein BY458DRAFT_544917 [Sporodiniella umbellata]
MQADTCFLKALKKVLVSTICSNPVLATTNTIQLCADVKNSVTNRIVELNFDLLLKKKTKYAVGNFLNHSKKVFNDNGKCLERSFKKKNCFCGEHKERVTQCIKCYVLFHLI